MNYYHPNLSIADLKYRIIEMFNIDSKVVTFFINDVPLAFENHMSCSQWGIDWSTEMSVWYQTYKDIVKHQNFEGYWTSEVLEQVNKTVEDISSNIPEMISSKLPTLEDQLKIVCTVIAIKTLKSEYPQKEKEWKLIAKKGSKYLQKLGFDFNTLESIL